MVLEVGNGLKGLIFPSANFGNRPAGEAVRVASAGPSGWRLRGCSGGVRGRREAAPATFFTFFLKPPCAGPGDLINYTPVRHPPGGATRSLRRDGAKSACPKEDPRGGSAGRDAEHEEEMLVRAGAERSRREEQTFFF